MKIELKDLVLKGAKTSVMALAAMGVFLPHANAQIDEIIVRASKRETNLQSTPIAVSAITSEAAENLIARDIGDVAILAPNFSASKVTGFNAASFAMRGAGQTDIIVYSDPQVGVAIDDFIVPHVQTQLLDVFDIEQVEVLRGPQGTLFGKNTTAGMVTLRTKRPEFDAASAKLSVRVADYGRQEVRTAVNLPISDTLAIRASALITESDGYYKNGGHRLDSLANIGAPLAGDGRDLGAEDVFSGRFKVLYQPSDDFSALFQVEAIRDNSDAVPSINESPASFVWSNFGLTRLPGDPLDNAASTNRDDQNLNMSGGHQVDVDGYYMNLEWDLGDKTLTSITGYREQESRLPSTYTGVSGNFSLFDANRADDRETFQQEIRLASDGDGPLDYVLGAFYQTNDTQFCVTQVLGFYDAFGFTPAVFGAPALDTFNNNAQVLCNKQDATAEAIFVDGSYDVNDRLTISGGLRYTWEEKSWTGRNQVFYQLLGGSFDAANTPAAIGPMGAANFERFPTGVLSDSKEWSEPSYRLTASYQMSDNTFGYANYSHSFKSGAYNDQVGTTGAPLSPGLIKPTNPEIADSIELGIKSDLMDNQLRLNVAVFNVDYEDAQRQLAFSVGASQETRFFNAAEVNVKGIEVEAVYAPASVPGLDISANFAYQDGNIDKFEADSNFNGTIEASERYTGRPLTRTPEMAGAVQINYAHDVSANFEGLATLTASFEDDQVFAYSDAGRQFDTTLQSKTLVDVAYKLSNPDKNYSLTAFVKNATDERYRVSSQPVATLWVFSQYGPPRTVGLDFTIGF
ncbi:MAG: TonB-dependent receptor [Parvibaculales bacterium]